jgi:iron complex outermembrane receptor protein
MTRYLLALLLGGLATSLMAEEMTLDDIEVTKVLFDPSIQTLSEDEAQKTNTMTLQERLERDVSFSAIIDNKGEMALSFRGLGFRKTGYIEDEIPLYRNVNGLVDPKFVMTDATLEMNDGSATGTLGVTPAGGEVIIYSSIPDTPLEATLFGTLSNNDRYGHVSTGSRMDNVYIQADATYYEQNDYRLSSDFQATAMQPGGKRINSDVLQKNLSLKTGMFIGETTHIAAKLSLTRSESGIPPNVTIDPFNHVVWNDFSRMNNKSLDSLYLYGDHDTERMKLIFRAYYDDYQDVYDIYDDPDYTVMWPSVLYDDSRRGVILKSIFDKEEHHTTLIAQFESNRHERNGGGLPVAHFQADTLKFSALHQWEIDQNWHLDGGLGYTMIRSRKADEASAAEPPRSKKGLDGQLKLTYTMKDDLFYGSAAHKNRMPAMVEMFTFFPWVTSNPNLNPEKSLQYTLGYQHDFEETTLLDLSLYYYDITDLIIKEALENQHHYINRKSAIHYGAELRVHSHAFRDHKIQFSYAYTHTKDSEGNPLEYIPRHQLIFEDTITITPQLEAFLSYRYTGSRHSSNSAHYENTLYKLSPYQTVDMQLSYALGKDIHLRIGTNNLLDENYQWRYGYPAKGREYYFSVEWKLP